MRVLYICHMQTHLFSLLLGGNQGNEVALFGEVRKSIECSLGTIQDVSLIYTSPAWGFESSPFTNQAMTVLSDVEPTKFMTKLLAIEQELGRIRNNEGGYTSRNIDIDILLIDGLIISTPTLTVPHPRMHERKFALTPLTEIASNQIHPIKKQSISVLLQQCMDNSEVTPI
jgi:deoxyguanosine kinase